MVFRYPRDGMSKDSAAMRVYQVLAVVLLGLFGALYPIYATVNPFPLETISLCVTMILGLWVSSAIMSTSDVVIDDDGIGWVIRGKAWRIYHWKDIRRVRISRIAAFASRNQMTPDTSIPLYCFDVTDTPRTHAIPRGTITVTGRLLGIRDFLDLASRYISEHKIKVFDMRGDMPVPCDKL